MAVLSIKGLEKSFGDKEVLRGLDLSVPEHSIFGFVGRNGSGKTTTMKAVLGLLRTDGGEIYVGGERVIFGQTRTNRMIGYLPDVPEFYPFMTATEYLRLCGEGLGMDKKDISERGAELLSLVGLSDERHRIKGYSRGMKQRLGIAQALLGRPRLLICDEPTSALDPIGRKEILDILASARSETTVLFSTHVLSDVERICTDVALLNEGRIAMRGSVDELKKLKGNEMFTVISDSAEEVDRLLSAFPKAKKGREGEAVFGGGDEAMFEVMSFIARNRLSVKRIERAESSLESIFVEVMKK